MTVTSTLTDC